MADLGNLGTLTMGGCRGLGGSCRISSPGPFRIRPVNPTDNPVGATKRALFAVVICEENVLTLAISSASKNGVCSMNEIKLEK